MIERKNVNLGRFGYKVEIEHMRTHRHRGIGDYADWREEYTNTFGGIAKELQYPDVTSIHDFQYGEQVYVVWAEWSTGDSFGWAKGGGREAIAVFKTLDDATNCARAIRADSDNKEKKNDYDFFFRASDGQEVYLGFAPWAGYFENLETVHVEPTTIGSTASSLKF